MKTEPLLRLLVSALRATLPPAPRYHPSDREVCLPLLGRLLLRAVCLAAGGRRSRRLISLSRKPRFPDSPPDVVIVHVCHGDAHWLPR